MRNRYLTPALLASVLATTVPGAAQDVKVLPLSMGTLVDGGKVVQGTGNNGGLDGTLIQRTTAWMTQEIEIGNLEVQAGVGGIFWYTSPTPPAGSGEPGRFLLLPKFGPGITRVDMTYRFGDVSNPRYTLQAGYFPYKYNSDAKNLGEYMLRSGAYPGYLSTGGWNLISGGGVMVQGARFNVSLWEGKFQSDFILPMEQDLPPVNGDFSPTYIATVRPVKGVELGGGAQCYHCLSVRPSFTSPRKTRIDQANYQVAYGNGNGYVIDNPDYDPNLPTASFADLSTNPNANVRYMLDSTRFYTFKGVKLMARASFDPKAYVSLPGMGPEDLKIFGEIALLGVKNYPFYYEKRTERMPVMAGINAPSFEVPVWGRFPFDLLSLQVEYYGSRFPNTTRTQSGDRVTMPIFAGYDAAGLLRDDPNLFDFDNKNVTEDNWKWSLYAQKNIVKGMSLFAQVANDHMRLPNEWGTNSLAPATTVSGDWYYLVRLQLGI